MSGVNITDVVESVLVAAGQPRAVFLLKSLRYLPVFVRSPTIAAAVLTTCGILLVFLVKSHAFQYLREQAHDIQMNIWPRPWTVSVTNADSHCRALEIFLESKVKFLHRPGFEACQRPATGSEKGDFSRGLKHQSHNGEIFVTYKDRSDFVSPLPPCYPTLIDIYRLRPTNWLQDGAFSNGRISDIIYNAKILGMTEITLIAID
jgi:hypothetical protein